MMQNFFSLLVATTLLVFASFAPPNAQSKVGGVISWCQISTDLKFAERICNGLHQHIKKATEKAGLPFIDGGSIRSKDAKNFFPAVIQESANGVDVESYMHLVIEIRGTRGATPGSATTVIAGFHVKGKGTGAALGNISEDARIVVWQKSLLATGPAKKLPPNVVRVMGGYLDELFEKLGG